MICQSHPSSAEGPRKTSGPERPHRKPVGWSMASTTVPSPGANLHSVIDSLMQSFGDVPIKHLLCPQPHAGCWGNRNKSNTVLALEFSRRTEL